MQTITLILSLDGEILGDILLVYLGNCIHPRGMCPGNTHERGLCSTAAPHYPSIQLRGDFEKLHGLGIFTRHLSSSLDRMD